MLSTSLTLTCLRWCGRRGTKRSRSATTAMPTAQRCERRRSRLVGQTWAAARELPPCWLFMWGAWLRLLGTVLGWLPAKREPRPQAPQGPNPLLAQFWRRKFLWALAFSLPLFLISMVFM